jgi:hypothetical protein
MMWTEKFYRPVHTAQIQQAAGYAANISIQVRIDYAVLKPFFEE